MSFPLRPLASWRKENEHELVVKSGDVAREGFDALDSDVHIRICLCNLAS